MSEGVDVQFRRCLISKALVTHFGAGCAEWLISRVTAVVVPGRVRKRP
jgi:hypothetical protein